ncbi:hypothetical protein JCM10212_002417 [Sporobolomyces blumeae]
MTPPLPVHYHVPGHPTRPRRRHPWSSLAHLVRRSTRTRLVLVLALALLLLVALALTGRFPSREHSSRSIEISLPSAFVLDPPPLPGLDLDLDLDSSSPSPSRSSTTFRLDPGAYRLVASDSSEFTLTPRRPCNRPTVSFSYPPSTLSSSSPSDPRDPTLSTRDHRERPAREAVIDPRTVYPWTSPTPPLAPSTRLEDRLARWLAAPLAPQTTWTEFNRQTCGNPRVRRNENKLHARENRARWLGPEFDEKAVWDLRRELVDVLRDAEREGRFNVDGAKSRRDETKGIVWTAGNADTFERVLVSLRLLRQHYNSTLPAEVFHFASEHPSAAQLAEFERLSCRVVSLDHLDKSPSPGRTKSFHIKGSAMVRSSFDQVLYLDSDAYPVRSPDYLFDSREFTEYGAVFWEDYWRDGPENPIWSVLGVQCRDEATMESGVVLIRKSQHLDALILLEHMLKNWRFWFSLSDGDKDLLRYSFLALGKRWSTPSRPLSAASWTDRAMLGPSNEDRFAGHTMLQFGIGGDDDDERDAGAPLFVHGNLVKRIAGTFQAGQTWGRHVQLSVPRLEPSSRSPEAPTPGHATTKKGSNSTSEYDKLIDRDEGRAESTRRGGSSTNATQKWWDPSIVSADDFVNVSPFTGIGVGQQLEVGADRVSSELDPSATTTPTTTRRLARITTRLVALLSRGVSVSFWDGHRGVAYVLAIEPEWSDELGGIEFERDPRARSRGPVRERVEGDARPDPDRDIAEETDEEKKRPEGMPLDEYRSWRAWLEVERTAECSVRHEIRDRAVVARVPERSREDGGTGRPGKTRLGETGFLEVVEWDKVGGGLAEFEQRFFEVGGKPNGNGF